MSHKPLFSDTDYRILFNALPSLVLILLPDSPEFTIVDASDDYLAATLTQRDKISGKGVFTVFPENPEEVNATGMSELRTSLNKAIETKQSHTMTTIKYDIPVPDELGGGYEERYWIPRNTPVMNEQQEVIYILNEVADVTENVLRKKQLALQTQQLERQSLLINENQERVNTILSAMLKYTAMDFSERITLTDKQDELDAIASGLNMLIDKLEHHTQLLIKSNADLKYANDELDSFSYSVSHDLRAPLRAISGYSQILLEDYQEKLDEEGRSTIEVIVKNASKMGALIDDLLTFSRVGKQDLSKGTINMDYLVNNVLRDLKSEEQNKTEFHVQPLKEITADSKMLVQVMTNLLSNAIKYSSKKENPVVEIGCYEKESNVIYFVKDNGAGFDMKYYNKLFGVFQRLHSPNQYDGTGVGLALVQRIIKKHHGEIWAEAKPDEGAVFYFSLPLIVH